jgi:hypothetical protein
MEAAKPGEILVSRTIRDVMTGSDLRFTDRGERELKGIGRWQVFAVESPAAPDETPFGPAAAGPAGPGQMPWRAIAIWGAVAALSFFWGSAVLGIVFRLATDDVQAWWVVLVLGPIPIVVLLAGTARSCGERTRRVRRPYRAASAAVQQVGQAAVEASGKASWTPSKAETPGNVAVRHRAARARGRPTAAPSAARARGPLTTAASSTRCCLLSRFSAKSQVTRHTTQQGAAMASAHTWRQAARELIPR